MSLRSKTLLLTSLSLAALVGLMYLIAVRVLLSGYARAEEQEMGERVREVVQLLSQRQDALDSLCHDWSSWDDTYAFIVTDSPAYVARNLTLDALKILNANLVVYLDTSGRVVYGRWYDFERDEFKPLPQAIGPALATGSPLVNHPRLDEGQRGFLDTPQGLLMVVSRPILNSDGEGPCRGTLLFGRPIADTDLALIEDATEMTVVGVPCPGGAAPPSLEAVYARLLEPDAFVSRPESENEVAGYTLIRDIWGQPAAVLRIGSDRDIFQRGLHSVRAMLIPVVLFGAALAVLILLTLERVVLSRVARLSSDVAAVGQSGDPAARVSLAGKDELSRLADGINGALAALAESRLQLQEREARYRDLVEATPDRIWQTNAEGVYTYMSPNVREALGYEPEQVVGRRPMELMSPEEGARVHALLGPVAARHEPFTAIENTCLHADGHPVVVESSAVPIFDDNGEFGGYRGVDRDITDRKRAEEALRESNAILRAQQETTLDGILVVDPSAAVISYNQRFAEMWGIPDDVLTTRSDEALVGSVLSQLADPEAFAARVQRIYEDPDTSTQDEIVLADGRVFDRHSAPMTGDDGTRYGRVWYFRDITERRQRERALAESRARLQESEAQYRDLVETTSDWNWEVDQDMVCTYVSPKVRDTLGCGPEDLLGRTPLGLMTPDEAARIGKLFAEITARREPFARLESVCYHTDGRRVFLETSGVPVFDVSGEFRGYRGVNSDITERRQAEEALAAEEERLRVTLRSIGDAVIATDVHGRVSLVSRVAEQLTGWTEADALGRRLEEIFHVVHQDTREPMALPVADTLAMRHTTSLPERALLLARDGTEYLISDSAAPIFDRESCPIGAVLVFRDVTAETHLREEADKARRLESVGLLAGGIAHDFNNLLTVILGGVQMAQMVAGDAERQDKILKSAQVACVRAADLTQKLLTFAKGGAPIKEVRSLDAAVRETVEFALTGSSVAVDMSVAPDLWLVEMDAGQISQVIQNLVLNAVQAMPGGGRLHVSLENRPGVPPGATDGLAGPHVAVTVRDEGIGIPPEHLANIFDPYFTTKQEGSGLGLTTCYSIVNQHEGSLSATSQVGVGSTFTVCLPRAPEDARLASSSTGLASAPRGDARILIMDDERSVRDVAIVSLGDLGYQIEGVSRGEDAIAAYEQALHTDQPFDLVILDLTVRGGMGGRETIEQLRQIDPHVRAIVCSGYSADLVMRQHREHGFAACVAKPFDVQKLAHTVHDVLNTGDA